MTVCVYCSSSDAVDRVYFEVAEELGLGIVERGDNLVYGGSSVGLMGTLAKTTHEAGGKVLGVMPAAIADHGIGFDLAHELIITETLRERKEIMEKRSEAFVALPGGFGTLEELMEILTLKQLRYHSKPVVILNTAGFYDPLLSLFEHLYDSKFAKSETRGIYAVRDTVPETFAYLDAYEPISIDTKWYTAGK